MSGRAKRLHKFMLRQQVNMNNITTKLTADDHNFSTAPTSLLQANLFLSTFVCLVKVTEGVSGHTADFVAILAVVLTRHSHGEHEGGARVWTYRNLDQLPFFC